jgi:hypothetical protein
MADAVGQWRPFRAIIGHLWRRQLRIPPVVPGAAQYDWRELQSWQIGESRLPAGSTIRFREPTVWERYRWQAALISAIILVQGSPISTLLIERRRRCFAEVQSRQRMAELAHTNRDSMAGELTASIAHELISHSEPSSPMPRRRN